jgi:hypothetical protein
MASAAEMSRRIKSLSKITVLREIVYGHIKANEEELRLLKEEEYETGNIFSNNTTAKYANRDYALAKHEQNPRAGFSVTDLILTGSFINSFKIKKPNKGLYQFTATDSKSNELIGKYSDEIMGLNQETFDEFQLEKIKPLFVKDLQEVVNKK